jgi:hypothetical protein
MARVGHFKQSVQKKMNKSAFIVLFPDNVHVIHLCISRTLEKCASPRHYDSKNKAASQGWHGRPAS